MEFLRPGSVEIPPGFIRRCDCGILDCCLLLLRQVMWSMQCDPYSRRLLSKPWFLTLWERAAPKKQEILFLGSRETPKKQESQILGAKETPKKQEISILGARKTPKKQEFLILGAKVDA